MAEKVNISKRRLKNSPMYVHSVIGSTSQKFFEIHWTIHHFFRIKDNIEYYTDDEGLDLSAYIIKKRRSVIVGLIAEYFKDIEECYVDYGTGGFSTLIYPEKNEHASCVETELPFNVFNNSRNMLLKEGTLRLIFRCEPSWVVDGKVRPLIGCRIYNEDDVTVPRLPARSVKPLESDAPKLAINIKNYVCSKLSWDFVVYISDGTAYFAHKAILAARSNFFMDYINENKGKDEITLLDVTNHHAIGKVIGYLYHGQIYVMSVGMTLEILELAVRLQIQGLQKLCITYMKENVQLINANEVRRVGKKLGLEELVEASDEILS